MKKAGEVSSGGQQQQQHQVTIQTPMMDIPIVNVPDYPDRTPIRPGPSTKFGPNLQNSQRQGLTAPQANDMSCSGPIFDSFSQTFLNLKQKYAFYYSQKIFQFF